jgi:hypothetical protein
MRPLVTVVVPVLADTAAAAALVSQMPDDPRLELVVVDGGHDESLERSLGARPRARLIRTAPGRARQMNAGAAIAGGEWLLFLHADSWLPRDWLAAFSRMAPEAVGGWFRFALDDPAWQARALERLVAWRVRWLRLPYGDQGLFVRRDVFQALGGYRDQPLLEDVDFVRRLRRAGAVAELPMPLATSARRWRRDGWLRRSSKNAAIAALYFAGVPPARLARWYTRGQTP